MGSIGNGVAQSLCPHWTINIVVSGLARANFEYNQDDIMKYKLYFDGACEPNPGEMGIGIVVYNEKNNSN